MKNAPLLLLLLSLGACAGASKSDQRVPTTPGTPWQGSIESWGTLREALRDGQVEGRVAVADVAREGVYAVGALADLRGEVTIVDGDVWVSEGSSESAVTTRGRQTSAVATVLVAAEVPAWTEIVVEEDVDPSVLDAFLAAQARSVGLDPTQPFPFLVEGTLHHLHVHVIAGECPMRARMLGQEMTTPPYRMHADQIDGRLVGIYAPDSSGILVHKDAKSHVHALLEQGDGLTGHAESVGLAKGAILKLPLQ